MSRTDKAGLIVTAVLGLAALVIILIASRRKAPVKVEPDPPEMKPDGSGFDRQPSAGLDNDGNPVWAPDDAEANEDDHVINIRTPGTVDDLLLGAAPGSTGYDGPPVL